MSATAMPGVGPGTERVGPDTAEAGQQPELPVFATPDGRRGRRLRWAALTLGVLVTLWLAGLVAGLLGFDALPALRVPGTGTSGGETVTPRAAPVPGSSAAQTRKTLRTPETSTPGTGGSRPRGTSPRSAPERTEPTTERRSAGTTAPTSSPTTAAPVSAATPPAPATARGPTASPGRRVGQTTGGTTPTTKPTPPGQAKDGAGPAAPVTAQGRPADAGPKPKS